jgi:hypothetical protein
MSGSDHRARTIWGWVGAIWGVGGVLLLLGFAIVRLTPHAVGALQSPLTAWQWIALVAFAYFMLHAEGYKGFQRAFSPRVVARARHLQAHPTLARVLFAPFFCMAHFAAPRRRRLAAIGVTLGVIVLVLLVRRLEQPWRGIIDVGVVLGLSWGVIAMLVYAARALRGRPLPVPAEVV